LSKGDIVIIFTDGLVEMRGQSDEFFGVERLKEIVYENCDKSAFEICNVIVDEVMKFKGGAEQRDDITLLVLKKI
ncbi:Stage II sporulation protein E (SpoIIE), partial [Candidatus Kryptobacter tengchongensis]